MPDLLILSVFWGFLEGDILKEVHGYPVTDMADLHIAMLDTIVGDTIEIKVYRKKAHKKKEGTMGCISVFPH